MAITKNIWVSNEPLTGLDDYATWVDDELASSSLQGLYYGSQAMGYPVNRSGLGERRYLYSYLPVTACVLTTISTTIRISCLVLSYIWRPNLHGK